MRDVSSVHCEEKVVDADDLRVIQFINPQDKRILAGSPNAASNFDGNDVIRVFFDVPASDDVRMMRLHFYAMNVDVVTFKLYKSVDDNDQFAHFVDEVTRISKKKLSNHKHITQHVFFILLDFCTCSSIGYSYETYNKAWCKWNSCESY